MQLVRRAPGTAGCVRLADVEDVERHAESIGSGLPRSDPRAARRPRRDPALRRGRRLRGELRRAVESLPARAARLGHRASRSSRDRLVDGTRLAARGARGRARARGRLRRGPLHGGAGGGRRGGLGRGRVRRGRRGARRRSRGAPNVRLAQADLFDLPFAPGSFDRVLCYGVLQHTPDPRRAFLAVAAQVRPGGVLAADVYRKAEYVDRWSAKTLWRPLTTRLSRARLRRLVEWYVPRWLPVDTRLARVPAGRFLVALVPCWNYTGRCRSRPRSCALGRPRHVRRALAAYDKPQTLETVRAWCDEAGLVDVDVRPAADRHQRHRPLATAIRTRQGCRHGPCGHGPRSQAPPEATVSAVPSYACGHDRGLSPVMSRADAASARERHVSTLASDVAPAERRRFGQPFLDVEQVPELEHQHRPERSLSSRSRQVRAQEAVGDARRKMPCRARCSSASSRSASGRSSPRSQRGEREARSRASAPRGAPA